MRLTGDARWIGWDLSFDQSIPLQRNEIVSDSRIAQIIERARKAAGSKFGAPFSEQRIDYVYKTWVNGPGSPTREFRLTIDKGAADNLVSFCDEDAKKISATQIEVKKADHAPDGNLSILFLNKLQ
jgi:hypothetical protein